MKNDIITFALPISTTDGDFVARFSEKGLCGLEFPGRAGRRRNRNRAAQLPPQIRRWHALTTQALKHALSGRRPKTLPPLDLSSGTRFQQAVWRALRRIAPGRTRSYAEVAHAIGRVRAMRAVGGACGANPIPVFIPCHRVIAADGGLGGFSSGLDWKRKLLAREGIRPQEPR